MLVKKREAYELKFRVLFLPQCLLAALEVELKLIELYDEHHLFQIGSYSQIGYYDLTNDKLVMSPEFPKASIDNKRSLSIRDVEIRHGGRLVTHKHRFCH